MIDLEDATGFDWDHGNRRHCSKHGMEPEEIETVFSTSPRIAPDWTHSTQEARFVAIGRTERGRAAFVVFTMRGSLIRPLSARYMHPKEVARHGT